MPLGEPTGDGGCLDAAAKIGSRGWAPRLARMSALRSPVENCTMDWLKEELTSNMAENKEIRTEVNRVQILFTEFKSKQKVQCSCNIELSK